MNPEYIESILTRANDLLEAGKPAETLQCLEEIVGALEDADDRIEFGTLRAWALSELGRIEDALDALDPLLEEFPESARLHGTRGVVLTNADDLDSARESLERAVSLDATDDVALANLALVFEKLHDFETAIGLYDRAIELGADIDWALQRKAAALSEVGDNDGAKATLKRYLSLAPDDAAQWITLAILHSDDEEYPQAFAAYETAERIESDSVSLRLNWGVTAVRAGQLKQARRQLRLLEQVAPASPRSQLLRAFILEEEGNVVAAEKCYERALESLTLEDRGETQYVFEMAMDFYAHRSNRERCDWLLRASYAQRVCSIELCEAYREFAGEMIDKGYWFSLMVEVDYTEPDGEPGEPQEQLPDRVLRNYQVIARDRDEAMAITLDFAAQMNEHAPRVREFVGDEAIDELRTGIYEVDPQNVIYAEDSPR